MNDQLRLFVLANVLKLGSTGIAEEWLLQQARNNVSRQLTAPELETELRDQADRGWIIRYNPPLGAHRWRITAFGRSTATEMGIG